MILNCTVNLAQGQQLVGFVSGDNWSGISTPAFMKLSPPSIDATYYWIAEWDTTDGNWLQLAQVYPGTTADNVPVVIVTDFTAQRSLPLANVGDVNIADLWNRAMQILDAQLTVVPIHGPTHTGKGLDPVPLAGTGDSGLLGQLSGISTDFVGGDNQCHPFSGAPTGAVTAYAGLVCPSGWLWSDGSAVSRTVYANLYAALGGTSSPWGKGDGKTTFNLPDLRGRTLFGAGAGTGLSNRVLGTLLGEENHLLTVVEMPAHAHPYTYDAFGVGGTLGFAGTGAYTPQQSVSGNTGSVGGGLQHNNMPPGAVINYIIRT